MFSLLVPTKTYAKSFYIKENVKKVWFSHARRNFSFFMYIKRTKQTEQKFVDTGKENTFVKFPRK